MSRLCLKMISYKKAFTLAELLIALAIIGILTSVLMPIVSHMLPDQNVIMAKRAFYTTETVVSNMINDASCYPSKRAYVGFDDGAGYEKCEEWGKDETADMQKKFMTLFADELDTKEVSDDKKTITTKEGIVWTFPDSEDGFAENDPESYINLMVDVNGAKEPNCGQETIAEECPATRKNGFDRFTMKIYARGKVEIEPDDCWAILAVRTEKKLTGKEDVDASMCDEDED